MELFALNLLFHIILNHSTAINTKARFNYDEKKVRVGSLERTLCAQEMKILCQLPAQHEIQTADSPNVYVCNNVVLDLRSVEAAHLAVEVVVVAVLEGGAAATARPSLAARGAAALSSSGEAEVGPEASALLQRLREHLVLLDVLVGHGSPRELHRLLEVSF